MSTFQFHKRLRERVQEAIEKETALIIAGYPAYEVYREQVGYLKGLNDALTIAEGIEKELT